ncbi:hypothetical protein [Actinophytocola oryzae]|uniref:Small secreted domain DUF320 n=1 Tax=Actinophytocola oryzae TaxID=502181 RepID=A0A4R7VMP4_9PSEU|nr:hypothetical protein [Actinophytocola oryzae]TDV50782.1 hypothetical protein CLV71_106124 [Actinophytocola oryzae]
MRRRVKSFVSAVALVFGVSAMTLLAGGGSASAAEPIVVGDCAASVQGVPGQPVSLAPGAVLGVVTDIVRAVPILGPPIAGEANKAIAALPPIPIGAVPIGTGYITGGTIATAVNAQLAKIPVLGGVLSLIVGTVQTTLTNLCGVTVTGVNAAAAPVQDGAGAVADSSEEAVGRVLPGVPGGGGTGGTPGTNPGTNPGTGPSGGGGTPAPNQPVTGGLSDLGLQLYQPGLWDFGRSPMADYSNIPFARAGMWAPSPGVRYGGGVPGYSPEFGVVGDTLPDDGVSVAGAAEALRPPENQRVEFPVLLAVLALSGVTASLVRTWVLRRAPQVTM